MFVLVAGGGRTAAHLATLLLARQHEVRVLEHRQEILSRLHHELPTEVIYEANPIDLLALEAAGIQRAKVLAACTSADEDNLALCYFARTRYQVPRTIAWINNPQAAWLFDEKFHVDVALNQAEIFGSLIEEEMSLGDMMTLLKLRRGRYSLVEEKIPSGAHALGLAIKDLTLPSNSVIATIIRHGQILIPRGDTQFEVGDEVLAIADREGAEQLARLFGRPDSGQKTT